MGMCVILSDGFVAQKNLDLTKSDCLKMEHEEQSLLGNLFNGTKTSVLGHLMRFILLVRISPLKTV
jgi:hypothetical protein